MHLGIERWTGGGWGWRNDGETRKNTATVGGREGGRKEITNLFVCMISCRVEMSRDRIRSVEPSGRH